MERRKGVAFEIWLVNTLKGLVQRGGVWVNRATTTNDGLFPDAKRTLAQTRDPNEASDVENTPGWWFEAKNHQRVNIQKAMRQAIAASEKWNAAPGNELAGRRPVVVSKDMRSEPLATMLFDQFLSVLENHKATIAGQKVLEDLANSIDVDRRFLLEVLRLEIEDSKREMLSAHLSFCPAIIRGKTCDPRCGEVRRMLGLPPELVPKDANGEAKTA